MWTGVAAAAVAISVATVTVVAALSCFAVTFESFVVAVMPVVTGFVAITAMKNVATVSVAAAASVRE